MRVAQQAGLPLAFDDDDERTQVTAPIAHEQPIALEHGPPSEARPVSFMPAPHRTRAPARVIVALAAVLFVGTLIGAAVTRLRTPAPAEIFGRSARTVSREAKLVAGSYFDQRPAPPATVAAVPVAPPTSDPTPSASATSSARAKAPAQPAKKSDATHVPAPKHTGADNVLMER